MVAGLQVINDSGYYQIDGSNPNLIFLAKGGANGQVTFNSPSFPVVFIRPSNGWQIYLQHLGGTSYRFYCQGNFSYWIFCQQTAPSQNFGFQIFGDAGQLLYESNSKPLKINRVVSYTRPYIDPFYAKPNSDGLTLANFGSILPNANFAFAVSSFGSFRWLNLPYTTNSFIATAFHESLRATPNGFTINLTRTPNNPPQIIIPGGFYTPDWPFPTGTITVADISGY